MFFFLTLYTQDVLGYSAAGSGLAQLPLAATIAAAATLAPRVVARIGPRTALVGGLSLLAGGLAWFAAVPPNGSFAADILGPSLVVGIGEGLVWVGSMVAATAGVQASESGLASGLVNTSQQLGGALGIAALVAVASAHTGNPDAAGAAAALTDGFAAGFTGAAVLAAAGAALAALLLPGRDRTATTTQHQVVVDPQVL
jgi:MFS family permease